MQRTKKNGMCVAKQATPLQTSILKARLAHPDMSVIDMIGRFNIDSTERYFRAVCKRYNDGEIMLGNAEETGVEEDGEIIGGDRAEVGIDDELIFSVLRSGPKTLEAVCDEMDCSPRRLRDIIAYHQSKGREVGIVDGLVVASNRPIGDVDQIDTLEQKEISFAVASDLHFGSRSVQITALLEFLSVCKDEGVEHVFIPGDLTTGIGVYRGQEMEVHAHGAEEQISSAAKTLPTGFKYYVMLGNHDHAFIRSAGFNIGRALSKLRDDIKYVGSDLVTIPLLPGVDMVMWHPEGGVPYALSYRLQKGIEQQMMSELYQIVMGNKERPTVRYFVVGHLHVQFQALFGSILGIQAGCFEGRNSYLKRKALVPAIGGWIIRDKIGASNRRFRAEFIAFKEIADDWKNYDHTFTDTDDINSPVMLG